MPKPCNICINLPSDESDDEQDTKYHCSRCKGDDCCCSESSDSGETESEYEVPSGPEYQFPSDEEGPSSESEVEPEREFESDDSDDNSGVEKNDERNNNSQKSDNDDTDEDNGNKNSEDGQGDKKTDNLGTGDVEKATSVDKEATDDEDEDDENKLPTEIQEFMQKQSGGVKKEEDTAKTTTLPAAVLPQGIKPRHKYRKNHGRSAPVHSHSRRKRSTRLYSSVTMPTGRKFLITIPQGEDNEFECGNKTKLIHLRPDGKMGKREFNIIAKEMEKTRRTHYSGKFSGYDIVKIEKIVNPCLWRRYRHRRREVQLENKYANEKMLFHGSPAWRDIIQNGFDERYSSKNGMFGAGVYFAKNSSKSNQYVYGLAGGNLCPTHKARNCMVCERVMILCRVTLGKVQQYTAAQQLAHPPVGSHSVEGVPSVGGLIYSENIVYRGEQAYPEFLITYKLKP